MSRNRLSCSPEVRIFYVSLMQIRENYKSYYETISQINYILGGQNYGEQRRNHEHRDGE